MTSALLCGDCAHPIGAPCHPRCLAARKPRLPSLVAAPLVVPATRSCYFRACRGSQQCPVCDSAAQAVTCAAQRLEPSVLSKGPRSSGPQTPCWVGMRPLSGQGSAGQCLVVSGLGPAEQAAPWYSAPFSVCSSCTDIHGVCLCHRVVLDLYRKAASLSERSMMARAGRVTAVQCSDKLTAAFQC